ncbi:MAG: DUF924 family protein [Jannaschia sp.]
MTIEAPDPEEVLDFWLKDCGPDVWYAGGDALDARIRDRFEGLWGLARDGGLSAWEEGPRASLALLILTDQFPRNMFRGTATAFATDALARRVAVQAIGRDDDLRTPEPERQFFYLPLEHSEALDDQDRAIDLIGERMDAPETLLHARVHREVIRRFGRFPFRNEALGRRNTAEEDRFLSEGGYGMVLRAFQAEGG